MWAFVIMRKFSESLMIITYNIFVCTHKGEIDQPPPEFREELSKPYQDVLDGRVST